MKDWRGVTISEGDQVLWVSHVYSGHQWSPRVGTVTKVNAETDTVSIRRELSESEKKWGYSAVSRLPSKRVTRIDYLPTPEAECGGLDAI